MPSEKLQLSELHKSTGVDQRPVRANSSIVRIRRSGSSGATVSWGCRTSKHNFGLLMSLQPVGHIGPTPNGACPRLQLVAVNIRRKLTRNEIKGSRSRRQVRSGGKDWNLALSLYPT
jgi:hypothetical protein